MRVTILVLLLALMGNGLLAGEEPKALSMGTACLDAIFSNPLSAFATPAKSEPSPPLRWLSSETIEEECPPSHLACVYYAPGDCLPCGPGLMMGMCHSWKCAPDGVLYTCCTCGFDVC